MTRVKHKPVRPVKRAVTKPEVMVKRLSQKKEVVVSTENLARAYTEEKKQEKEETTEFVFEGDRKSISLFTHCIRHLCLESDMEPYEYPKDILDMLYRANTIDYRSEIDDTESLPNFDFTESQLCVEDTESLPCIHFDFTESQLCVEDTESVDTDYDSDYLPDLD